MRILVHSLLLVGLMVWAGCPAPAVYQSADTLRPGAWQVGGALGVQRLRDVEQDTRIPGANLEVFARRGIAPNVDVGARLYTLGAEASVKWRFFDERWAMAVMPGLAVLRTPETVVTTNAWHTFVSVPLLASRKLSKRWSVSLGPKLIGGMYQSTASGPEFGAMVGGYGLVALHLGNFRVMPELDLSRTVAGAVPVDGWIAHFGIGLAWQR